jgi:hypothetical protein
MTEPRLMLAMLRFSIGASDQSACRTGFWQTPKNLDFDLLNPIMGKDIQTFIGVEMP